MLGEKLRKIRELKGFSQEYMANNLRISQAAYSKMERNPTLLSINRLRDISAIFNIELVDFLNFNESKLFDKSIQRLPEHINYPASKTISEGEVRMFEIAIKTLKEEIQILRAEKEKLLTIIEHQVVN